MSSTLSARTGSMSRKAKLPSSSRKEANTTCLRACRWRTGQRLPRRYVSWSRRNAPHRNRQNADCGVMAALSGCRPNPAQWERRIGEWGRWHEPLFTAAPTDRHDERRSFRLSPRFRLDFFVRDRKSTRLNSSHLGISYAVFCLKKKKIKKDYQTDTQRQFTWQAYHVSSRLYRILNSN